MKNFWIIFAGFNVLLFTTLIVGCARLRRCKGNAHTGPLTPEQQRERWQARAPGWQIRCLKCDFTEPYGKYGIRLGAAGKKYTLGYCSQCRGLRGFVIEKAKLAKRV